MALIKLYESNIEKELIQADPNWKPVKFVFKKDKDDSFLHRKECEKSDKKVVEKPKP